MHIVPMRKQLRSWIKSPAGKLSIFLLCIGTLVLYLAYSDLTPIIPNKAEFLNNVLISFGTGIFCIVITISFVQYFIDQNKKLHDKNREADAIIRYHFILSKLINRFLLYAHIVTTSSTSQDHDRTNRQISLDFKISDMSRLFKPSLIITDDCFTPTIELLFNAEIELKNYIISEIQNIQLNFYPNLRSILIQFVVTSLMFGKPDLIISHNNLFMGDKKVATFVSNLIEKKGDAYLIDFEEGKLKSNIIIPYILLYYRLKNELSLLNKYCQIIESIDSSAQKLINYTFIAGQSETCRLP